MGGISNATDAIEFMIAGANAIQVGTATFVNPQAGPEPQTASPSTAVANKSPGWLI